MNDTETNNDVPLPGPAPQMAKAIVDHVAEHGCAVVNVPDPGVPDRSFSFSVGFEANVDQPEILVYGLDKDLAQSIINEVFRQCRDEGLELADGQKICNLIEGYECMVRLIDDPRARLTHFGLAAWYLREEQGQVLRRACQIVWPDPETRAYPWEHGCGQDIIEWQVGLYPRGGPK